MEGMITRVSVTWTDYGGDEQRSRVYTVVPDEKQIIRVERLEDLLDDLTLMCEQLQAAQDAKTDVVQSEGAVPSLRRIK
jgi:hypothetical protein